MMLCKFCNREIADDSRFCIFCGSSQQETMPGESGTPNLPAETLPPVVYAVPTNSQELSKPKSKKRLGLIMGLVGGFVVIAMIAALLLGQGGIDPGRSSSLSGPLATIAEASKNAVKNGECAFQMTVDVMGEKIQAYYWTEMNQGMTSGSMYMDEEVGGQQIQFVLHDNRMMIRTGDVWEYQDMSYMNYMNYMNNYYGYGYGGMYNQGYYGYNPYYYGYNYPTSGGEHTSTNITTTSTEVPAFSPLLFQIFVE